MPTCRSHPWSTRTRGAVPRGEMVANRGRGCQPELVGGSPSDWEGEAPAEPSRSARREPRPPQKTLPDLERALEAGQGLLAAGPLDHHPDAHLAGVDHQDVDPL